MSPRFIARLATGFIELRNRLNPIQRFVLAALNQAGDLNGHASTNRLQTRIRNNEAQFAQAPPSCSVARAPSSFVRRVAACQSSPSASRGSVTRYTPIGNGAPPADIAGGYRTATRAIAQIWRAGAMKPGTGVRLSQQRRTDDDRAESARPRGNRHQAFRRVRPRRALRIIYQIVLGQLCDLTGPHRRKARGQFEGVDHQTGIVAYM